eukprot:EG_transcript_29249
MTVLGLLLVLWLAAHPFPPAAAAAHAPSPEQVERLPDVSDPRVAKRLRCSACKAVVKEVHQRLQKLAKLRPSPKSFEVIEALEGVCPSMSQRYGLLLKSNQPTEEFSDNQQISKLQGNWINMYLETACGTLFDEYEDDMVDNFNKWRLWSIAEAQDYLCFGKAADCRNEAWLSDEL